MSSGRFRRNFHSTFSRSGVFGLPAFFFCRQARFPIGGILPELNGFFLSAGGLLGQENYNWRVYYSNIGASNAPAGRGEASGEQPG